MASLQNTIRARGKVFPEDSDFQAGHGIACEGDQQVNSHAGTPAATRESRYSSCDFLDLESPSEYEPSSDEAKNFWKETKLTPVCTPQVDEYLDTLSKPAISRNSSIVSVESIRFEGNEYESGLYQRETVDENSRPDLGSFPCETSARQHAGDEESSGDRSYPGDSKGEGLLRSLSTRLWDLEESLSLSTFDSIRGIRAFLLGGKAGQRDDPPGDGQSVPGCSLANSEPDFGITFFSNSRNGYESQRSESDTSEESVRYPSFCLDDAHLRDISPSN